MIEEIKDIQVLIRARYPLIYVVSSEEQRVIRAIAETTKKQVWVWSCVSGINPYGELGEVSESTKDPLTALRFINNTNDAGIFILCDFHTFLDERYYSIIRYLKELNIKFKKIAKNIIILSPILQIPIELDKEISVVDFPLPNQDAILDIYEEVVSDVSKNPQVKINGNKEYIVRALMGLNTSEIRNVLYKSIIKHKCFSLDTIIAEKRQIIRKTGVLEYYHSLENIKNIGGNDIIKKWIIQRKSAFSDSAKEFGLPNPKGVLLLGVSGCGKSLICKTVANIWSFPLLRLDMAKIFEGIVGSSERNMTQALNLAKAISPCILWVDEIEKALSGVGSSNVSDAGTTSRVFGTFLTWLQEKEEPVFVVATANDVSALPPELLRKGRFDEIFFIDLPNSEERGEIFSIHIKKRDRKPLDFDLEALVKASRDFSGAEIESAIISGMFDAFDEKTELNTQFILDNLKVTVPLSKTMEEKITKMRDWAKNRARPTTSQANESLIRGIEL